MPHCAPAKPCMADPWLPRHGFRGAGIDSCMGSNSNHGGSRRHRCSSSSSSLPAEVFRINKRSPNTSFFKATLGGLFLIGSACPCLPPSRLSARQLQPAQRQLCHRLQRAAGEAAAPWATSHPGAPGGHTRAGRPVPRICVALPWLLDRHGHLGAAVSSLHIITQLVIKHGLEHCQ
jgi:hypothetical protein